MLKQYTALSIVAPNAERIAKKIKTLEVRSWRPETLPLKDVVIVENQNFLLQDGDEEFGLAVALVDIETVHAWRVDEVDAACATYWAEGYLAWVICNIRPIDPPIQVIAKRKLYLLELDIG
ncbi:RNA-binding protein [Acinetobacter proteolyticus]|uniref:RNA-binding protein n=1 Tax=Acinetobacter proteolyticus TaxID=1776741 RepID=A0A653K6V5_9GAMM|nr:ASCH domain-containing protein [Acinetobacter proteolyticus]OEY92582.1 RNA-binding protein [Acinetobacter proteolyticus]VXA56199.1 RNA-binding protein [Acinetobacter proteolyticus]